MKKELSWLLAGAAFTLCAGVSVAVAADARTEAEQDARAAAQPDKAERKVEKRREVRVFTSDDSDGPRVRVFRHGDHGDHDREVFVMRRGEGRGDHLKALLQLRPEQEGALKAFLEATGPQARAERPVRIERSVEMKKSTLEKLADAERRLNEQQAGTRRKIDAMRTFYNQLDDRQKRAFDEMPMVLVVGPDVGPMLIPTPSPIVMRFGHGDSWEFAVPPRPPLPPVPPTPPRRP